MEMSDEEKQRVRELVDLARSERREGRQRNEDGADCAVPRASPRKVIIDTDIGTDIDDALALLSALNMPSADLELVGIVTNYYPTKLRARVAQEMMRVAMSRCMGARRERLVTTCPRMTTPMSVHPCQGILIRPGW